MILLATPSGCGLVLDLQPGDPDAGAGMDAGPPRDAGRRHDAGTRDAGEPEDGGAPRVDAAGPDAGPGNGGPGTVDASRADAGPPAGDPCTTNGDCDPGFWCQRDGRRCFGEGRCARRPMRCFEIYAPVCGCDWVIYDNACTAQSNGVGVQSVDACPVESLGGEWCDRVPTAPSVGGCARCFDNLDCGGLFPYCVASSCVAGGEGICAGNPGDGYCHDQRFCDDAERCEGAVSDVCLPVQGRCVD